MSIVQIQATTCVSIDLFTFSGQIFSLPVPRDKVETRFLPDGCSSFSLNGENKPLGSQLYLDASY